MSLLEVRDLCVWVQTEGKDRQVLRDVVLSVAPGEALGLVGESGAGKSMTARAVGRMLPTGASATGDILFDGASVLAMTGRDLRAFRRRGTSFVAQNPLSAINPVHTIGDYLTEPLVVIAGMRHKAASEAAVAALAEVGIMDGLRVLGQYPHELSGGMLQRVMICSSLLSGSRLIVADEPTASLDVTTQSQVMAILDELRRERSLSLLFISHDLELAAAICDRISVMYAGEIVECQNARGLQAEPRHPYTRALFAARPTIDGASHRLPAIPGRAIAAHEAGAGCSFANRCPYVAPQCNTEHPLLTETDGGQVRCLRAAEIAALPLPMRCPP